MKYGKTTKTEQTQSVQMQNRDVSFKRCFPSNNKKKKETEKKKISSIASILKISDFPFSIVCAWKSSEHKHRYAKPSQYSISLSSQPAGSC